MKILVDENIPLMTVEQLRQMKHDVIDIRGTSEQGITDQLLWNKACKERCLLITTDRGFAYYRDKNLYGILIVSLRKANCHKINQHITKALKMFSSEQWQGLLVVMRDETMSTWRLGKKK